MAAETQREARPEKPTELGKAGWLAVLKRTGKEFMDDGLTDWAAALTYYAILSLFPALIALVSVVGLVGSSAIDPLIENLATFAPSAARDIIVNAIEGLAASQSAAGLLFFIGLAGALWAASGYVGAFMRASNAIYDVDEGRPFWKTIPLRLVITVTMLVLVAASSIMVVVTGPLAEKVGDLIGLGDVAVTAWEIAKWPVLILVVSFMFGILYWASPNVRQPGFRWISPGGILAVIVWMIASGLFALYVANFDSYNKTYGSLGAVIIFLVWLWISNLAVLLGAEFNAELQRGREIRGGRDPEEEPFLEPRDTRKLDEKSDRGERS